MTHRPPCRHRYAVERAGNRLDFLRFATSIDAARETPVFYWDNPASGDALLGIGVAHAIRTNGTDRLQAAGREALAVLHRLERVGAAGAADGPTPRIVGGFAFASQDSRSPLWNGFPSCWLFLPELLWVMHRGSCWCVRISPCGRGQAAQRPAAVLPFGASDYSGPGTTTLADPESERAHWIARAERALAQINDGTLAKVVLARHRTWTLPGAPALSEVVRRLHTTRPGCFTFVMSPGRRHFVGSTPELLVRVRGRGFETQALAGTAPRGMTAADDMARGAHLLASAKDQREHAAVTTGIEQALGPLAGSMVVAPRPELLSLPEAHHLHTPIRGTLRTRGDVLALADHLHPTAAVCGTPREQARALIETEETERGWYTGGVGWLDGHGDGVFAVALRAALLTGPRLTAWAGAGIVAGSDPVTEFDETELKMFAMLDALRISSCAHETPAPAPGLAQA